MVYYAIADIWSAFKEFNSPALYFGLAAALIYSLVIVGGYIYRRVKGESFPSAIKILYKLLIFTAIGVYTSYMISLTLSGREAGSRSRVSIIPGTTLFDTSGLSRSAMENIVLFVPLGILLPMLWYYFRSVLTMGMLSFWVSLFIEVTQFITQRGYFETDDIILNTFGGVIGYYIFAYVYYSAVLIDRRLSGDAQVESKLAARLSERSDTMFISSEWASVILQAVPIALCIRMIMGFSQDTGDVSRGWSRPIAFIVAKIGSLFADLPIDINMMSAKELSEYVDAQNLILDAVERVVRKCAHVTEYALLAVLIWILIISRMQIKRIFSYCVAVFSVMVVGMLDELNQTGVDGRFGSIKDVGIDLIGAIIAMTIAYITVKVILKRKQSKIIHKKTV